jgi:hypothetical protein
MTVLEILQRATELDAADIFLVAGLPVTFKCGGRQVRAQEDFLRPDAIAALVDEIYTVGRRDRANLERGADDDFSFAVPQLGRFRVNVFRQRGSLAAVLRVIKFGLPDPRKLGRRRFRLARYASFAGILPYLPGMLVELYERPRARAVQEKLAMGTHGLNRVSRLPHAFRPSRFRYAIPYHVCKLFLIANPYRR